MKFRVLGPLTVLGYNGPVTLGGVKQRAVLGHLLLHTDEVVATSDLLRALWAGAPPPTARKMLQNAVSALRGLLMTEGAGAGTMLLTHAPGYLLRVDGDDLDLTAYRALADRGRSELAAGGWTSAARNLRAALDLWRGMALADLAEAGAHWPELGALARARSATTEDLFEAELACGRHHDVRQDLETLVAREPARERLCGALMLALYRCGRQADALAACRRTGAALRTDLGLEPGRTLRSVERAILDHDPVLDQRDALAILAGESDARRAAPSALAAAASVPSQSRASFLPAPPSPPWPPAPDPGSPHRGGTDSLAPSAPPRAFVPPVTPLPPAAGPFVRPRPPHPPEWQSAGIPCAPAGALTEQRKQLSVLLVRTTLGKGLGGDPEDAARLSGELAVAIREEVERHGGTVSGVLGPVTYALFGAVRTGEDDAARAVRAGLAILDRLRQYGAGGPVPVRGSSAPRVAVVTGDVVVTCAADGTSAIPVVRGTVPKKCVELLETVPPGGIRVCETTRADSERVIEYGPATGPGGACSPLMPRPEHSVSGPDLALVGRDRESEQMAGALGDVVRKQRPYLLTVLGEPGSGKSRLARELVRLARRSAAFTVLTGRASWNDHDRPLALLARTVAASARPDGDPVTGPADPADGLARVVHAHFGTGDHGNWLLDRLHSLLRPDPISPADWPGVAAAWRDLLTGLATERPVLLVLEDLHSAPDAVLDLVDELIATVGPVPLLVAVTARTELLDRRPAWGGGSRDALTLGLDPLDEPATGALLDALLAAHGRDLPAGQRRELLARIGGNPLYAVEYAREITAARRPATAPPDLPRHLRQLVAARLDTLPPGAKSVLLSASALGGVCCADSAAAVGDGDRAEAADWLAYLERRDFLRRSRHGSPTGAPRYAFRHPATREVVDWMMTRTVREDRRRRAAAWTGRAAHTPV
ncbi:BTAD domain-containing putative transcriptional regulator [Streptomyces sp. NPDC002513]